MRSYSRCLTTTTSSSVPTSRPSSWHALWWKSRPPSSTMFFSPTLALRRTTPIFDSFIVTTTYWVSQKKTSSSAAKMPITARPSLPHHSEAWVPCASRRRASTTSITSTNPTGLQRAPTNCLTNMAFAWPANSNRKSTNWGRTESPPLLLSRCKVRVVSLFLRSPIGPRSSASVTSVTSSSSWMKSSVDSVAPEIGSAVRAMIWNLT